MEIFLFQSHFDSKLMLIKEWKVQDLFELEFFFFCQCKLWPSEFRSDCIYICQKYEVKWKLVVRI